jgi:glycosyltransferase involved in cell wall biosynthesis
MEWNHKMNILILDHESVYPPISGVQIAVYTTAKLLAKENDVTIFSWGNKPSYKINVDNLKIIHIQYNTTNDLVSSTHTKSIKTVPLTNIGGLLNIPQLMCIFSKGPSYNIASRYLNKNYDIVIKEGPDRNEIAHILNKKFNIPIVERLHWVGVPWILESIQKWHSFLNEEITIPLNYQIKWNRLMDQIVTKFEIHSIKDKYIITVSPLDKNKIRNVLPKKNIEYIYSSDYNENQFYSKNKNSILEKKINQYKPYAFFFSTIVDNLSIKLLIKIASEFKNINFLISGNFSINQFSRVPNNLKILGYLNNEDLNYVLSNSKLIVIPLLKGHGIQMKLMKALSVGKPIITTSAITRTYIDLKNDVNLLIRDDPILFKNAILDVIKNKSLEEYLSINSRKYYEKILSNAIHLYNISTYLKGIVDKNK